MAMFNDTWEKGLQSILSETETNIATLKKNMAPKFESTPYIPRQTAFGIGEGRSASYSPRVSRFNPMPKPSLDYQRRSPDLNEGAKSILASVSKRVEQLEQLTSSLNNSVVTLKYENKVQNEEIKKLKDELRHLTRKFHEKGIDLGTEQKLKKWQREVKSDMVTIKNLLSSRIKTDEYHGLTDVTAVSLSKDISDSKRLLLEEADLLRRDCDSMNTRILKLENEFAVMAGESKDLGMRHVRLEKDIISVNENYRSQSRTFLKIEKENTALRNAIEDTKHEIEHIQYDLKSMTSSKQRQAKSLQLKDKSSTKETSNAKELSSFRKSGKEFGSLYDKDKINPNETQTYSFDNLDDVSLLSSEFDDFSLNTSLNLSDEIDPLKSY